MLDCELKGVACGQQMHCTTHVWARGRVCISTCMIARMPLCTNASAKHLVQPGTKCIEPDAAWGSVIVVLKFCNSGTSKHVDAAHTCS